MMDEVELQSVRTTDDNDVILHLSGFDPKKHLLLVASDKEKLREVNVNSICFATIDRSTFNRNDKLMISVVERATLTIVLGKKITVSAT